VKVVLVRQHSGPEVLEYADFPKPEPKPGEALIRLHAAALNRVNVGIDNVGMTFMQSLRALPKGGRLLTVGKITLDIH